MQDIEREDNIAGNHDDEEDGDDAIQQQFSHYLSSTTAVVSVAPWPSLSQYIFFSVDKRIDISSSMMKVGGVQLHRHIYHSNTA